MAGGLAGCANHGVHFLSSVLLRRRAGWRGCAHRDGRHTAVVQEYPRCGAAREHERARSTTPPVPTFFVPARHRQTLETVGGLKPRAKRKTFLPAD